MYVLTFITTIGALQGVIILLSILARFRHRKNLPLAILLIVFSVRLGTIPTWNPDILISYPWVYPLTAPLPFLFGPLLWWYIRELVSDTLNVPKHVYLHFLPWLFEISALTITILSMNSAMYEHFVNSVFAGSPPLWLPVRNALKVAAQFSVYVSFRAYSFREKIGTPVFNKAYRTQTDGNHSGTGSSVFLLCCDCPLCYKRPGTRHNDSVFLFSL